MEGKDRNLDRLSDTHTCYQGPWRHADVPSSFNESLVAPPPGNAVSKGSIAKFWHQSFWTFWRETMIWLLPSLSATSRLASVAVTLLAQGLSPEQPTNQVTNYWRWTKVQPSQPNLGQCQRALVAPDLHVKSAEAAVVPEAVPVSLCPIQLLSSPSHRCSSPGHSLINILHAKLSPGVWFPRSPPRNSRTVLARCFTSIFLNPQGPLPEMLSSLSLRMRKLRPVKPP